MHAHNQRFEGCDLRVGDDDVVEFILARREDPSALVDFGGIDEIEHREMLHVENFVHAFEAEATLTVEEVGDVGLLEAGLLRQTKAGEFSSVNALPKDSTEIFLKHAKFHGRSISRNNS